MFDERMDVEAARARFEFIQMVKDVVDFFGIDLVLDEGLEEDSFGRAFSFLRRAIRWDEGGEFDSDLSLDVIPAPNPDSMAGGVVGYNDGSIVSCDYYVEAFGYRMTARIVVETKDCRTRTEPTASGGYRHTISGHHKVSAAAMEAVRYLRVERKADRVIRRMRAATEEPAWVHDASDEEMFQRLRVLRKSLADEARVPPYVVFSDRTLRAMVRNRPQTEADLLEVPGVGQKKLERYGAAFLDELAR